MVVKIQKFFCLCILAFAATGYEQHRQPGNNTQIFDRIDCIVVSG